MKGFAGMITLAVVLVGGVIAFGILDAVTSDTLDTSAVTLEAHTITNGNGSAGDIFTLGYIPIVSVTNVTNNAHNSSMTVSNNYTVDDTVTGQITITNYDTTQGACCEVSYIYDDGTYLSGGLSRTIVAYIVPIGLLGLLGLAILFRR